MKKFLILLIMALLILSTMNSFAFAAESNLIEDAELSLKTTETPNRLEVSFNLTESIDLSQGNSNIVIEYFAQDSNENLQKINYIKDKFWSGYLNSYENYPSGEHKYSSGYANDNYSDKVPATKIYTSVKTGAIIDVALVAAVKITVLRADGSGEAITVGNDGAILGFEEIEASNNDEIETPTADRNLGIRIDSETTVLPLDTILVAKEVTGGPEYEKISSLLTDTINFIVIEIKLELNGQEIQPDGKVKISIPIPEDFSASNLAVYRIENGTKIPYTTTLTTNEGIKYATFLTNHFSTYVLAEVVKEESGILIQKGTELKAEARAERETTKEDLVEKTEKNSMKKIEQIEQIEQNKIPITGRSQTLKYNIAIIIFIIGILLSIKIKKVSKTR